MQTGFLRGTFMFNWAKGCFVVSPSSYRMFWGIRLFSFFFSTGKLCVCKSLLWASLTAGSRQQTAAGKSGQIGSPRKAITRSSRTGSTIAGLAVVWRDGCWCLWRRKKWWRPCCHISRTTNGAFLSLPVQGAHLETLAGNHVLWDLHLHEKKKIK